MQSVLEANRAHTGGHDRPGATTAMARNCESVAVPGVGQRIYAISYRHNGDIWFATVGQIQTGKRRIWKGRKRTEEMINIETVILFGDSSFCES
jgi:hypothetical protein